MPSCEECRAAFAELEIKVPEVSRATRLDRMKPGCCCQELSVSSHSPGALNPDEVLIRLLVAPQHMSRQRRPKLGALTDAEWNGLSVFRKKDVKPEEIVREATKLVERARAAMGKHAAKAGVFGALEMTCSEIRDCKVEEEEVPAYCVYDTALLDLKCHAEAFQRVDGAEAGLIEKRRQALFDRVGAHFVPVEDFMGGLLRHLAPQA